MHESKAPLRNRLIVAIFLLLWGAGQVISLWHAAEGDTDRWSLFVSSAPSAEAYPRVDSDMRFDAEEWRWTPILMRGDQLLRIDDVDLRGASHASVTKTLGSALRKDGEAEIEWVREGKRRVETYRSEPVRLWWTMLGLPLSITSAIAASMLLLRAPHWPLSGLGFVCLGAKRSGDIYTSTELALLTALANVVSVRFHVPA